MLLAPFLAIFLCRFTFSSYICPVLSLKEDKIKPLKK